MRQKFIIGKLRKRERINIDLFLFIGFLSIVSVLTIYLPDDVRAFQRCPEHGTSDLSTIRSYSDETFCNVYHTCNCNRSDCQIIESHVCPIAQVYSNIKGTCLGLNEEIISVSQFSSMVVLLDIEEEGCDTTYVQWVQTHSTHANQNQTSIAMMISDSLLPSPATKSFQCDQDQPGKFRFVINRLSQ